MRQRITKWLERMLAASQRERLDPCARWNLRLAIVMGALLLFLIASYAASSFVSRISFSTGGTQLHIETNGWPMLALVALFSLLATLVWIGCIKMFLEYEDRP